MIDGLWDRTARALLSLLAASTLCGCTMLADTSDYEFCKPGSLRCSCKPDGLCDPGLDCRPPGRCIDPTAATTAAGNGG